jgi:hypothetical protein
VVVEVEVAAVWLPLEGAPLTQQLQVAAALWQQRSWWQPLLLFFVASG